LQPSVSVPFHEKYRDCAGCPSITAMEPGAGIEIVMNAPEAILAHAATASNGERYYTHARPLPARHGLQAFERLDARHWPAYVVTRPGAPPLTLPVTRAEYVAAVIRELEGERGAVTGDLAQGVSALEREVAAARARRDAAAVQAASEALREMRKASVELQGGGVASDGVAQLRRELAAMSPVDRRRPAYLAVTHADSADDVEEKGRVMSRLVDDARNGVPVVRINPAYWDRRLPRTTPQLLIIAFSRRHDREAEVSDANMHRALREVEDALDWSALRAIVERPER